MNTELFENMPINKAVQKLAIPSILSSLVMIIYNMADTYFVGMLNDSIQTAAVTLAGTVLLSFFAVSNLFGVGASSAMARALGKRDHRAFGQSSAFGFYCALFCSIGISILCLLFRHPLLSLLGADSVTYDATYEYLFYAVILGAVPSIMNIVLSYYVRSEGASLQASIGTMSGCVINIILDPFFILPFGLNLKAAGAGLATCIANCCACAYFMILILKKKETWVSLSVNDMFAPKEIVLEIFSVGIPAAIQNLLNVVGTTILNNFTAGFGADAIAAMGISQKIQMIPMQVSFGASQGVMPLVSYNYSSNNRKRMKDAVTYLFVRMLILMLVMLTLGCFFSESLIRFFMDSEQVVLYGKKLLVGLLLALPFLSIDFGAVGVFQAIGDGRTSLIFAILRKIILEIPAIILLNWIWPLYGMGYSRFVAELILSIAAIQRLRKIFSQ